MGLLATCYYRACGTRGGHTAARETVRSLRRLGLLRRFDIRWDALELDGRGVAGLVGLWSRTHWSAGDGMMPADQLLALYRLALEWPAEGAIVELGAWVGLTTSYLATACRVRGGGRVYAVDTFRGTREGDTRYPSVERHGGDTLPAFRGQIHRAGVEAWVEALIGDTGEVARRYNGGPIRLLLIDADHSYEGVRRDFRSWSPHVAPGGIVVFHDYLMSDVARFVDGEVCGDDRYTASPGPIGSNVFAVTRKRGLPGRRSVQVGRNRSARPVRPGSAHLVSP